MVADVPLLEAANGSNVKPSKVDGERGADLPMPSPRRMDKVKYQAAECEPKTPSHHMYQWEPKSLHICMINWWHVFRSEYVHHLYNFAIVSLVTLIMWRLWTLNFNELVVGLQTLVGSAFALEAFAVIAIVIAYVMQSKPAVYCLENTVFVPPESWQVSHDDLNNMMRAQGCFEETSMDFLGKVLDRSGTGDSTHWPPAWHESRVGKTKALPNISSAREEAEAVVFPIVEELLSKAKLHPRDVDFLIVNCSIFTPTPSLCAMICNKFQFRRDVRSYNLGGMGCSANVISVDLAKQLLQNRPGSRAMVISTENLTQNLYHGNDKSMLLQNTLFRCGGSGQLLSSRWMDAPSAKYKLLYTGRTQMSDDNSFNCVYEQEDSLGKKGIALSKDIVKVAGRALKHEFVQLAPHVLPIGEQLKTVANRAAITIGSWAKQLGFSNLKPIEAYTPDFTKGVDHFCIHAGGRAVIDGVQQNLNLSDRHVRPSKQTLYDWGNTSSSSIWYEAEWVERFGRLQKGDRMLQIAFGSGFKCNSAVWLALKIDRSKQGVPLKSMVSNEDTCKESEEN